MNRADVSAPGRADRRVRGSCTICAPRVLDVKQRRATGQRETCLLVLLTGDVWHVGGRGIDMCKRRADDFNLARLSIELAALEAALGADRPNVAFSDAQAKRHQQLATRDGRCPPARRRRTASADRRMP